MLTDHLEAALRVTMPGVNVSIGDPGDKSTWRVNPPELQAQAQPIIDAFDPNDPTFADADADAAVDGLLDANIAGDLLSALLDNFAAMQAEVTAGTFKPALWKQRLRARVKILRRAKPPA